jgi:hypothetical protein
MTTTLPLVGSLPAKPIGALSADPPQAALSLSRLEWSGSPVPFLAPFLRLMDGTRFMSRGLALTASSQGAPVHVRLVASRGRAPGVSEGRPLPVQHDQGTGHKQQLANAAKSELLLAGAAAPLTSLGACQGETRGAPLEALH